MTQLDIHHAQAAVALAGSLFSECNGKITQRPFSAVCLLWEVYKSSSCGQKQNKWLWLNVYKTEAKLVLTLKH